MDQYQYIYPLIQVYIGLERKNSAVFMHRRRHTIEVEKYRSINLRCQKPDRITEIRL